MSAAVSPIGQEISEGAKALLAYYDEQQRARYADLRDQFVGVTSVDGGRMHDLRIADSNTEANWSLISGFVELLPKAHTHGHDWRDTEVVAADPFVAKQVTANTVWQRHPRKGWLSPNHHTPSYILGAGIGDTAVQRFPRRHGEGWQRPQNSTTELLLTSVGYTSLRTVRVFDSELAVARKLSARAAELDYPEGEVDRMYDGLRDALLVDSEAPGSMVYEHTTGHRFEPDPLRSTLFMTRRVDTFQTAAPHRPAEIETRLAAKGMHAQPRREIRRDQCTDSVIDNLHVVQGMANLAVAFDVVDETMDLLAQFGATRQPTAAEILLYRLDQ